MSSSFVSLPVARYQAVFVLEDRPRFSAFPGSAWRGALGHALKRTVCVTHAPVCDDCPLYQSCLYPYFFDSPPPPDSPKMRRYETAPHPFVLFPEGVTGDHEYRLGFTLIGHGIRHLPVFIHALKRCAEGERGVAHTHFQLLGVRQETALGSDSWKTIFEPGGALVVPPAQPIEAPLLPADIQMEVVTPLRLKRAGRHVGSREFRFSDLFGNLLRRISMLTTHHTDASLEADFQGLMALARSVPCEATLKWQELTRYSARQKTAMQMGGLVGTVRLHHHDLTPFWPYLWFGQWVHAGTGATMGLGQYRVSTSLSLPGEAPHRGPCGAP